MSKDYAALQAATMYDIDASDTQYEPEFLVGTTYSWEEVMQYLTDWNMLKGNDERAQYLIICKDDKAYYFAEI